MYRPPPPKAASKSSSTTLCQKCLKRDIYECKTGSQARPYIPRPSRTQQLLNPKLVPKLTNDAPNDLLRKKGVANETLARIAAERSRNRSRSPEMNDGDTATRRARSRSVQSGASVSSVSTISTNRSRTRSPPPPRRTQTLEDSYMTSQAEEEPAAHRRIERNGVGKRRRSPSVEYESLSEDDVARNTRRRRSVRSPDERGRGQHKRTRSESGSRSRSRSRSRGGRRPREPSPTARRREHSPSRSPYAPDSGEAFGQRTRGQDREQENFQRRPPPIMRERSMSPFSKRLALTQAMGGGRGRGRGR